MSKVIVIDTCDECPRYSAHREKCGELDRKIPGAFHDHPIPGDCPWPDCVEEDNVLHVEHMRDGK